MSITQERNNILGKHGYKVIGNIGQDNFSSTYKIAKDGQNYTLKLFDGSIIREFSQDIIRNIEIYKSHSQNIQTMIYYQEHFIINEDIYLITEYCQYKTLDYYLNGDLIITEQIALLIIKNMSDVIQILCQMGIVHCDISPNNIYIINENTWDIKLSVFCLFQKEDRSYLPSYDNDFFSPQYVNGSDPYNTNYDIYCIGILGIKLCIGSLDSYTRTDIDRILIEVGRKFSQSYGDLISKCISEVNNRIEINNLISFVYHLVGVDSSNNVNDGGYSTLQNDELNGDEYHQEYEEHENMEGIENVEEGVEIINKGDDANENWGEDFDLENDELGGELDDELSDELVGPEEIPEYDMTEDSLRQLISKIDEDIFIISGKCKKSKERESALDQNLIDLTTKNQDLTNENENLSQKLSEIRPNSIENSDTYSEFNLPDAQQRILEYKTEIYQLKKKLECTTHTYQDECLKRSITLHPSDKVLRNTLRESGSLLINKSQHIFNSFKEQEKITNIQTMINKIFTSERILKLHPKYDQIFSTFSLCCDIKNSHNNMLDLSNYSFLNYGEGFFRTMSKAISSLSHLVHINLNNCSLGDHGIRILSEGIKHLDHLEALMANGNQITNDGFSVLIDNIQNNKSLQILSLDDNSISDMLIIRSKIERNLSSLTKLFLKRNSTVAQDSSMVISTMDGGQCTIYFE